MAARTRYSVVPGLAPQSARALLDEAISRFPLPLTGHSAWSDHTYERAEREYVGVIFPDGIALSDDAWQLAAELARLADRPFLELRIQEGDHWDFTLYKNGATTVIADFSTRVRGFRPDATTFPWKAGTLEVFATTLGIRPDVVAPYLIDWDSEHARRRVRPDDKFETGDYRQLFDFTRVLGIPEPQGHPDRFLFKVPGWTGVYRRQPWWRRAIRRVSVWTRGVYPDVPRRTAAQQAADKALWAQRKAMTRAVRIDLHSERPNDNA